MSDSPRAFLFPPFRLDLMSGALYRGNENLNLRPKTFDTLVHLLLHQGQLVSKKDLMDTIWSDAFVTDDVLVQSIADIRRVLGDDARNPTYIQTVPKRGYIFIKNTVPVSEGDDRVPSQVVPDATRLPSRSLVRSLQLGPVVAIVAAVCLAVLYWNWSSPPGSQAHPTSIAVLPFEVQSDSEGFQWLATGVADMIGTGLWKSPDPVISGSRLLETSYQRFGPSRVLSQPEALDLARALGARRAIVGKVIKFGSEIQINASLIDLSDDNEDLSVWERATAPEKIFEAVDAVCLKLLQALAHERGLHGAPGPHLTEITTDSLEAYRHYIAGLEYFRRGGREGVDMAEVELREATRVDPGFGMAHFKLAQVRNWSRAWGYSRADPTDSLRRASQHSADFPPMERLLMSGMVAWMIEADPDQALGEWSRLEGLYPMFSAEAGVPVMVVGILVEQGRLREAIEYGDPFLQSPYLTGDDKASLSSYLSKASRKLGDIPKALAYSRTCVENWPVQNSQIYRFHLINLGRIYLSAGQVEMAVRSFSKARDASDGDAANLTDAGWGFYMAGMKEEAKRLALSALQTDPDYGNAYHLLAWIDLNAGETARAAARFQMAFEKTPPEFGSRFEGILEGDLPALYYAGVAFQKLRQPERSHAAFFKLIGLCQRFRERDTNRTSFLRTQSLALEALAWARLERLEESSRLRVELQQEGDPLYENELQLARIYAVQNDPSNALLHLQKAIQAGAREFQHLRDNPDFDGLRDAEGFRMLGLGDPAPLGK